MNSAAAHRKKIATSAPAAQASTATVYSSAPQNITPAARRYAIAELAIRAGVTSELRKSWRLEVEEHSTTIVLDSAGNKKIVFPTEPATNGSVAAAVKSGKTIHAGWAYPPPTALRSSVPDFVVPFVMHSDVHERAPIFAAADPETVRFNFDLPAAALHTLSRSEETIGAERDKHGRFPASASIAVKENFLDRPIVDEYGFALEQALRCLLPQWSPQRSPLRVKLSHDVDEVGIPFILRSSLAHTLLRRRPGATLQDFVSVVTGKYPIYLDSVLQLAKLSERYSLDSAFYWKATPAGTFDSGYDPTHAKIMSVFCSLSEQGFESGVHPGYDTFRAPDVLRAEVDRLRRCIGTDTLGGRQHYLRWLPETWRDWETCDLAYDSSVGFADQIGFRAGTCIPYHPWLWNEKRAAQLLEIPLLVMDRTLAHYMKLSPQQSFARVIECVEKCRTVGGVFTMLWHNEALIDPLYGDLYQRLLQHLSGAPRFDWRAHH